MYRILIAATLFTSFVSYTQAEEILDAAQARQLTKEALEAAAAPLDKIEFLQLHIRRAARQGKYEVKIFMDKRYPKKVRSVNWKPTLAKFEKKGYKIRTGFSSLITINWEE